MVLLLLFSFNRFFHNLLALSSRRTAFIPDGRDRSDKSSCFTFSVGFLDHRNLYLSNSERFYRGDPRIIQGQERDHTTQKQIKIEEEKGKG